jgi:hypothetical protein
LNSPMTLLPEGPESYLQQYDFPEMGVSLRSMDKTIWTATFFFSSYVNDMPFDLPQKARRDDVHKILGSPSEVTRVPLPFTERYKSESYELEEFSVTCWYLCPSDKLDSMIVHRQDFLQSLRNSHSKMAAMSPKHMTDET